jgi:hypothetical protein
MPDFSMVTASTKLGRAAPWRRVTADDQLNSPSNCLKVPIMYMLSQIGPLQLARLNKLTRFPVRSCGFNVQSN